MSSAKTRTQEGKYGSETLRSYLAPPMAVLYGVVALGGFGGAMLGRHIANGENRPINRDMLATAATYDRCLAVAKKNTEPGSATAIVRLANLSPQERQACGLDQLEAFSPTIGPERGSLDLKVVDAEVQLPSQQQIEQLATEYQRAGHGDHVGNMRGDMFIFGMFGAALGLIPGAFAGVSIRKRLEHKEATTSNSD